MASWPWLFAINIPVGVVTFYFAWKYLPDNPTRIEGRRFDYRSACMNALTFGLFIGTLEAYAHGASLTWVFGGLVLLLAVGTLFVRQQLSQPYPMLPFDLLRIPVFGLSVLTSICSFTSQMLAMVSIPFLLHHTFGFDAVRTGLFMTAWPLVIVFASPVAGFLVGKIHAGLLGGHRSADYELRMFSAVRDAGVCATDAADCRTDAVWLGIRTVPVAQQSPDAQFRSSLSQWRCERHAGYGPSRRSDHGSHSGGFDVPPHSRFCSS